MIGLTFSSKLDWGSYIVSIAKTASRKTETLVQSMKFLSSDFALYLHNITIIIINVLQGQVASVYNILLSIQVLLSKLVKVSKKLVKIYS